MSRLNRYRPLADVSTMSMFSESESEEPLTSWPSELDEQEGDLYVAGPLCCFVAPGDPEELDPWKSGVILDFLFFSVRGGLNSKCVVLCVTGWLAEFVLLREWKGIAKGGRGTAPSAGVALRGGVLACARDDEAALLLASRRSFLVSSGLFHEPLTIGGPSCSEKSTPGLT